LQKRREPMKIEQIVWKKDLGWKPDKLGNVDKSSQLVLVFGAAPVLQDHAVFGKLKGFYPGAHIFGCSTAGEICGTQVWDDSLVATAITFEHAKIEGARISLREAESAFQAGEKLAASLAQEGLVHVFVLSDGLNVNGSDLVRGLTKHLPKEVTVTGGLAGDGDRFKETLVFWDGNPEKDSIAAIGLYGTRLRVGYGSLGGWDPFGPERLITRSRGNVLYELDGRSALELYKQYLGEHAKGLPATGLLFPLSLRTREGDTAVVRTILSINENDQSLTFAGDVPEGSYARLMKANFDRLIDGAVGAARTSYEAVGSTSPDLDTHQLRRQKDDPETED